LKHRLDRLRHRMTDAGVDAFLIASRPNVRYLSGFSGSSGALLVRESDAILFTDSRYTIQADDEVSGVQVETVTGAPLSAAVRKTDPHETLGFESAHLSVAEHQSLSTSARCKSLAPVLGLVEAVRVIKEAVEIEKIKKSIDLNSMAFEAGVSALGTGCSELEVAAIIEHAMKSGGASSPSFESIVASGPRGALPHARPTVRVAGAGEAVVVDIGAMLDGYASDMTRTVFMNNPGGHGLQIYQAVAAAVQAAEDQVRSGVPASTVDAAARKTLKDRGFADNAFRHGTGHGVGLEVHEAPRISPERDDRLESGMVLTIEPGIYEEGWGGVRIEDVVVVEETGCRILTSTTKEMLTI
jgi:Xaa-Pro aminopeptidase